MPRIRSVHPWLFTDESFIGLPPRAQIFLIGLWTEADDQGVFPWRLTTLGLRLGVSARGGVEKMLTLLVQRGLLRDFSVEGARYGAIRDFRKVQKPQRPVHLYPLPEGLNEYVGLGSAALCSNTAEAQPAPMPDTARREEKGSVEQSSEEGGLPKDPPAVSSPVVQEGYSEAFEKFWRGYPTTAVMSRIVAWRQWQLLKPVDQERAIAALPAYRTHCAREKTYRPCNPDKFLFERRFDQLTTRAAQVALDETAMKTLWEGRAAPLVDAMGPAAFNAWFGESAFTPGPPVTIALPNKARCFNVNEMYGNHLRAIYGDDIALVVAPRKEVTA